MGAGLSGLSCALILEKYGIEPVIFEKRSEVEDRFINCEILLNNLYHPINDGLIHLKDNYDIYLRPQHYINKLFIHSENNQAEIKGKIGYTNLRGRASSSFGKQLAGQLKKSKIKFNSNKNYQELKSKYSHIVLAT
ncbi:MAG: NAD(P)-binding protein, partial [Bacillota bacterium]